MNELIEQSLARCHNLYVLLRPHGVDRCAVDFRSVDLLNVLGHSRFQFAISHTKKHSSRSTRGAGTCFVQRTNTHRAVGDHETADLDKVSGNHANGHDYGPDHSLPFAK
jgi:hypothetical protein